MLRRILFVSALCILFCASTVFAQDLNKSKVNFGVGPAFALEGFSTNVDVGVLGAIGYERRVSSNISVAGEWSVSKNSLKADGPAVTVNAGEAYFKYHFKQIERFKTPVVPYILFAAGVTVVDYEVKQSDLITILSTTFGGGINWTISPSFAVFVQAGGKITDETKRLVLTGGLSLPIEL